MAFTVSGTNTSFTPAPAGTHVAVCCQLIDLGCQHSEFYDKDTEKIMLGWELSNVLEGEPAKPRMVWKQYTRSLGKKANLRGDLENWRGRKFSGEELAAFDMTKLLGAGCLLSIIHDTKEGTTYANVDAVMALPQGTPKPLVQGKTVLFDIDQWDEAVFGGFSENLQAKIRAGRDLREKKRASSQPKAAMQYDEHVDPALDEDGVPF